MSNINDSQVFDLIEGGQKIDLFQNQMKANTIRKGMERANPDGTVSTVLMVSGEVDGRYYAWPTLFPGYDTGYDTQEWAELDTWKAFDEAEKRGELFQFNTEAEAVEFAKGSWKNSG